MKENDCISRKQAIERLKLNFPISQGADNSRDRHRYMQALADIQAIREMPSVTPQAPKFIAKSDGTIEQIINCNDCILRNEWGKIGKLLSIVLEKQAEQEPNTKNNLEVDCISRDVVRIVIPESITEEIRKLLKAVEVEEDEDDAEYE